jgi:hypothetical protein
MAMGGKLPGLGGGTNPTGGAAVDGTEGFSARLMWRKGSSDADTNHIYIVNYMYHMDKPSTFGEDLWWNNPPSNGIENTWSPENKVYFEQGRWHTVKNMVKINTPGEFDGKVVAWLDGTKVLENNSMRFRAEGVSSFKVDQFFFSTFYGGGSSDWAPQSDAYFYFDDFIVSTEDPSPNGTPTIIDDANSIPDKNYIIAGSNILLKKSFKAMTIISSRGEKIKEYNDVSGIVSLSYLNSGVYIVVFNDDNQCLTEKIIIK